VTSRLGGRSPPQLRIVARRDLLPALARPGVPAELALLGHSVPVCPQHAPIVRYVPLSLAILFC